MTQPHIPDHDADSARDADAASTPSYPRRSTAQDHSATQELPAAQDATREMPSATTIPAPPAGTVPPATAPAADPSADVYKRQRVRHPLGSRASLRRRRGALFLESISGPRRISRL